MDAGNQLASMGFVSMSPQLTVRFCLEFALVTLEESITEGGVVCSCHMPIYFMTT
jgi:hypothetical protein